MSARVLIKYQRESPFNNANSHFEACYALSGPHKYMQLTRKHLWEPYSPLQSLKSLYSKDDLSTHSETLSMPKLTPIESCKTLLQTILLSLTLLMMIPLISRTERSSFLHSFPSQMRALTFEEAGLVFCSQNKWFWGRKCILKPYSIFCCGQFWIWQCYCIVRLF